jgi:hypothetical protein
VLEPCNRLLVQLHKDREAQLLVNKDITLHLAQWSTTTELIGLKYLLNNILLLFWVLQVVVAVVTDKTVEAAALVA